MTAGTAGFSRFPRRWAERSSASWAEPFDRKGPWIRRNCTVADAYLAALEEEWAAKLDTARHRLPINPAFVSHCLNRIRDPDTIIVRESPLMQEYVTQLPGTMLNAGSASGLGHGMGVALGAKLAAADRLVIGTEGDGPYMLNAHVSCHYAAAEHLPHLWVIFNHGTAAARALCDGGAETGRVCREGEQPTAYVFHG